ncbi:hypothetical protein C8J56DRAFT_447489 [Mycena floridula]|nr:hypothetical protein C8J56DRAFT_447489 [Mycena floridula]
MTKGGAPRDWPTTYFRYIAEIMRCIVPFFCSTFAYYLIYFNLPDGAKLVSAKAMDNVATHAKQSLARICVDLKGNPNNYIPQNPRKDLVKHKLTGSEHQPPITEEQLQIVKDRYQRIRPVQGDETSPVNEYQTEDDFGSQFMLDQYRVPLAKIGFQFCLVSICAYNRSYAKTFLRCWRRQSG